MKVMRHDRTQRPSPPPASFGRSTAQTVVDYEWPLFFHPLKQLAQPGDRGMGDIIHRYLGGDAFPNWFEKQFGRSCGCVNRVDWLNQRFPYRK
jgi:hypothetical protein